MPKKPFTTRLDGDVFALAAQLAEKERRSVTSVIELAILAYAQKQSVGAPETPRPAVTPREAPQKTEVQTFFKPSQRPK